MSDLIAYLIISFCLGFISCWFFTECYLKMRFLEKHKKIINGGDSTG